ncbi:MAG: pilin [Betaproteobacteria bacterium]|nr:pilin [Betaproteobacteria bacterium]
MQKSAFQPTLTARGFTLIEVVIVMAIIAILALMTIPMFFAKIPREQVEESLPLARIAKDKVANYYKERGALPANNEAAELPDGKAIIGNYVSAVTVTDGAVTMTFRADANGKIAGKRLTWRPAVSIKGGQLVPVAWVCAGKKVPDGMDVGGTNVTDAPKDVLPVECR